jgi:hypothetical protein
MGNGWPVRHHHQHWHPTHRLVLRAGDHHAVQTVAVMLMHDGFAYTRYAWLNDLPPAAFRNRRGRWTLNYRSDVASAGRQTDFRIESYEPATPDPADNFVVFVV